MLRRVSVARLNRFIYSRACCKVIFGRGGDRGFTLRDDGVWDPAPGKEDQDNDIGEMRLRAVESYGTGDEPWFFTSEVVQYRCRDCAGRNGRWV